MNVERGIPAVFTFIIYWFNSNWNKIKQSYFSLPLVIPNIEQQNKIVEYLDAKCSKIDEIVEKQKVIIEKLEEYKLSIITEAVTSGINPRCRDEG